MFRKKKGGLIEMTQGANKAYDHIAQMIAEDYHRRQSCGGWNKEELDSLDRKFDALCEYLKVEFVQEKISDGSDIADKETFYCRKKDTKSVGRPRNAGRPKKK